MSGFEWFLLIVVVIVVPLVVAVAVTLWTLEQARQRNRRNREADSPATAGPVKRQATRTPAEAPVAEQREAEASASDAVPEEIVADSPPASGTIGSHATFTDEQDESKDDH